MLEAPFQFSTKFITL